MTLRPLGGLCALLALAGSLNAQSPEIPKVPELELTDSMRKETRWVVGIVERAHYKREPLKSIDMSAFLQTYMEELDYNRHYFLEEDAASFRFRFGRNLISWLEKGNLYPAMEIYRRFHERAAERIEWVYRRLDDNWDFSNDDTFRPDREDAPWPASMEEANDLWERRLKYELLNEILPQLAEAEEGKAENPEVNEHKNFTTILDEAREDVRRRYERFARNLEEIEATYVQERFLTTLAHMYDPHSDFLSAESLEDFAMHMRNSFVGIGAILQDDDGYCTIRELLPGGPAEGSRELDAGDVIVGVGQGEDGEMVDVIDMALRKVVKLIKGEQGSIVRLMIREDGDAAKQKVVELRRDEIKLTANLASAEVFEIPMGDRTVPIGAINLPSFYGGGGDNISTTTEDVEELIGKLKDMNVSGLILDLRRNGGGLLSEAVSLTGLFIPDGPVVQVRDTEGNIRERFDTDPKVAWNGPLMVLVSRYSASASEIVAGALKNHRRALIVGDPTTHGKGTVQAIFEMRNRSLFAQLSDEKTGAAKVTIQKFYLPSGASTQKLGVESDIALPSINPFLPIGESDLDNALAWDTIDPLGWEVDEAFLAATPLIEESLIDQLRELSEDRQAQLPEFDFLNRSIDYFRERRDRDVVSLNLEKRRQELKRDDRVEEGLESERERLARKAYPTEEILVALAEEQEAKSAAVREKESHKQQPDTADTGGTAGDTGEATASVSPDASDSDAAEKDNLHDLDIHLRESLRIMRDWIALEEGVDPKIFMPEPEALTARKDEPRPADPAEL
ncbi:MAG: carboxy terminal-processing peptidase [Opitutales bacterium]